MFGVSLVILSKYSKVLPSKVSSTYLCPTQRRLRTENIKGHWGLDIILLRFQIQWMFQFLAVLQYPCLLFLPYVYTATILKLQLTERLLYNDNLLLGGDLIHLLRNARGKVILDIRDSVNPPISLNVSLI